MPGTQRERIQTICRFCGGLQCIQRHSGLCRDAEISRIDGTDTIESGHTDDNGMTGRIRGGTTTEAGIAPLGHNRHACCHTETNNLRHLFASGWQNNCLRTSLITPTPILEKRSLRFR